MKKKCPGTKKCVCHRSISERIKHFSSAIRDFNEGNSSTRKKILKKACPCFVRMLCETCLNVLKGNLKLNESQYKKLKPHKHFLLDLIKPSNAFKERKALLVKKGGKGLPLLLTGVGVLMNILNSFL